MRHMHGIFTQRPKLAVTTASVILIIVVAMLAFQAAYFELRSNPDARAARMRGYGREMVWTGCSDAVANTALSVATAAVVLFLGLTVSALALRASYDLESLLVWAITSEIEDPWMPCRLAFVYPVAQSILFNFASRDLCLGDAGLLFVVCSAVGVSGITVSHRDADLD